MSIKKKLMLSSIVMLVLPIFIMVLISAFIFVLVLSYVPSISIQINGITPSLNNPMIFRLLLVWLFILIVVVLACCIGVTAYLSKSIIAPLKKMSGAMEHLTEGDLSYEFTCSGDREIKEVYDSIENLRVRLKKSVDEEIKRETEHRMLIANISHDLKTPITSIKGYVEGIKDGVADTPEMLERYLNTIQTKANTLEAMVNNLSEYSKLDLDSAPYDIQVWDIRGFVRSVLEELSIDLSRAGIELDIGENLSGCEEIYVRFDCEKLNRVLSNIISNSIKYRKPDIPGKLSVELIENDGWVILSFSDNGIGISKQEEKKVFETFFRADPARNLNVSGNGLGLSIACRIIKEHGGKIWMRSGGDKNGVTVYIRLKKYILED